MHNQQRSKLGLSLHAARRRMPLSAWLVREEPEFATCLIEGARLPILEGPDKVARLDLALDQFERVETVEDSPYSAETCWYLCNCLVRCARDNGVDLRDLTDLCRWLILLAANDDSDGYARVLEGAFRRNGRVLGEAFRGDDG